MPFSLSQVQSLLFIFCRRFGCECVADVPLRASAAKITNFGGATTARGVLKVRTSVPAVTAVRTITHRLLDEFTSR